MVTQNLRTDVLNLSAEALLFVKLNSVLQNLAVSSGGEKLIIKERKCNYQEHGPYVSRAVILAMCILFYSFIFVVLKIEPSSLCMQGKSCTTEPHPLTLYFARLIFLQSKDFTCDTFSKAPLWFSQLLKSGIEVKILSLIKSYYLLFFLKYYQI